jgi:hypothetical protein
MLTKWSLKPPNGLTKWKIQDCREGGHIRRSEFSPLGPSLYRWSYIIPAKAALCCTAMGMQESGRAKTMASKIDKYRAGALRCERRAKKTRNQADREWELCLAGAYRILAETAAEEHSALLGKEIQAHRAAA